MVAADARLPVLVTVAESVRTAVSTGAAGLAVTLVMVRSGFGAGMPVTSNVDTWPLPAPVLAVNTTRTSVAEPVTGKVTLLPAANEKAYCADALSVVQGPLPTLPSIEKVCVRGPHAPSGGTATLTCCSVDCDARFTARVLGY